MTDDGISDPNAGGEPGSHVVAGFSKIPKCECDVNYKGHIVLDPVAYVFKGIVLKTVHQYYLYHFLMYMKSGTSDLIIYTLFQTSFF